MTAAAEPTSPGFAVHLDVFEGPFDLLLGLIGKHQLDVTEISLGQVTDDFLAYVKALGPEADLEHTTSFLLVAATLLDLKASRLLPTAEVEDEEDLALLEVRDLLFARLLQYRAFRQVARDLDERLARESHRYPRAVGLEPQFAALLPEVLLTLGPEQFAELASKALTPRPEPLLALEHLHAPTVSVREQAAVVMDRLRRQRSATFRSLSADSPDTQTTVARFLALLELFREGVIAFEQAAALGELHVRWTGSAEGDLDGVVDWEFDDNDPAGADDTVKEPHE